MNNPDRSVPRFVRAVLKASDLLLCAERWLLSLLMGLLVALVLLNVVTRYTGHPIYWVDEASVFAVVWLTFVGASIMTRLRLDFAVGLLTDKLGPRGTKVFKRIATLGVLSYGLAMLGMCWLWLDPVGIARYGFDAKAYAAESFNFLYTLKSQTLEWPIWLLQLIMPLFALAFTLHALANLLEDMDLAQRRSFPEFGISSPDAVN
jgi:TRAP-type C4-dicarboxylate transport system permease small subunit